MLKCFNNIYKGRKVLVTGHTGFKGSWLCLWLKQMGAEVVGYSLKLDTDPSHFELLKLDMVSVIADVRNYERLEAVFQQYKPEIVFHMAAQPLVRYSYQKPQETFETNVMGTVNVYEAAKKTSSVRAIVNITSDKCYDNKEWVWGYRESDAMGGYDPYSASKGCAELVTSAYQRSFFNISEYKKSHRTLLASVRAGNVIGGGDWALDRLVPDIVRAVVKKEVVPIRSPKATRPWQHVLEPLSGYLLVGQRLLEGRTEAAQAWNFGPGDEGALTVEEVTRLSQKSWDKVRYKVQQNKSNPHEAHYLKLDCSKAHIELDWTSLWSSHTAIANTIEWYRAFYSNKKITSLKDLSAYMKTAKDTGAVWIS